MHIKAHSLHVATLWRIGYIIMFTRSQTCDCGTTKRTRIVFAFKVRDSSLNPIQSRQNHPQIYPSIFIINFHTNELPWQRKVPGIFSEWSDWDACVESDGPRFGQGRRGGLTTGKAVQMTPIPSQINGPVASGRKRQIGRIFCIDICHLGPINFTLLFTNTQTNERASTRTRLRRKKDLERS